MASYADLSKGKKYLIFAIVALTTFFGMGDFVITPVSYLFYEMFDNEAAVNFFLTGPYLISAFVFIAAGVIADRVNKKLMLVVGGVLYAIGSIAGIAIENVYYMCFMHSLCAGIGYPLVQTAGLCIVAEMFTDEAEHGKFVGFYSAVMSIMGAILAPIAGVVALSAWQNVYRIFWVEVPLIILCLLVIPSIKVTAGSGEGAASAAQESKIKGWWVGLVPIVLMTLIISACYFSVIYLGSVYIVEEALGDESYVGIFTSVGTVTAFVTSILFGFVFSKIRDFVAAPSLALIGVMFLVFAFIPTPAVALFASGAMGCSWGLIQSYFLGRASDLVPEQYQGSAIGAINFVYTFGCFLATYFTTFLQSTMGFATISGPWTVMGVISLVLAGLYLLYAMKLKAAGK